jgi:hypothetical protein
VSAFEDVDITPYTLEIDRIVKRLVAAADFPYAIDPTATSAYAFAFAQMVPTANPEQYR